MSPTICAENSLKQLGQFEMRKQTGLAKKTRPVFLYWHKRIDKIKSVMKNEKKRGLFNNEAL